MITLLSLLSFLSFSCISLSLSAALTHTHTFTPTECPHLRSLSVSHTHRTKKRTSRPQSLSGNEKSISFYHFSLSIIQFHDLDHTVGNLDGVQIADKANFLVYFCFFNSYNFLNKLFILHSIYLSL